MKGIGILLLLSLLGALGCARNINVVENSQMVGVPAYVDSRVIYNDFTLKHDLQVTQVLMAPTAGGPLKVQATLHNTRSKKVSVNYRFSWYDSEGMKVGRNQVWRPQTLLGKQSVDIADVAPSEMAVNFKLELIETK